MSRSAGNSWRVRSTAIAMLLLPLALSACAKSDDTAMAEKLAAAEAAAEKAVAAQKAAENAAAIATSSRPAPTPTAEPETAANSDDTFDPDNPPHGGMSPDETNFDFQNGVPAQGA